MQLCSCNGAGAGALDLNRSAVLHQMICDWAQPDMRDEEDNEVDRMVMWSAMVAPAAYQLS